MYSGAIMSAKLRAATTSGTSTNMQRSETLKPRRSQAKRQWSIQAVKGKVTTTCLWNACKALTIGILLIFIGAGMATIGYYAEEAQLRRQATQNNTVPLSVSNSTNNYPLPLPPHTTGSRTHPPSSPQNGSGSNITNALNTSTPTTIINSTSAFGGNFTGSRPGMGMVFPSEGGFGLNKLSYVGPIVMGFGGFVIVAACVMTFEARDSAAKIVPARFRKTFPERNSRQEDTGVRNSSSQTKWETLGLYGSELMRHQSGRELSRRAMTFAFIQFSKNLQTSMDSAAEYYDARGSRPQLVKCPSAPSLVRPFQQDERRVIEPPRVLRVHARPAHPPQSPRRRLTPNNLPRQAMSVDNPAVREVYTATYPAFIGGRGDEDLELGASATGVHQAGGSDASLAMDLHLPQCSVTLAVRDQSRSPSNTRMDFDEASAASPLLDPDLEAAGPSGLSCVKVDKQTSTSDHQTLSLLGISHDTWGSRDAASVSARAMSGSFRESRRPRPSRRVRRSETIDTATAAHRRTHVRHHSTGGGGNTRHGSVRSGGSTSRSTVEARRLHNTRSETARRHQFLRQQKIETGESHEDVGKQKHYEV
ncbi:uncharacterized protein [Palaemon carinicauda]|uniref:uncharacterized protein n=1 Tax=Palaemon carinicauda TaxID=392227 RepID=UPI0035B6993F